MHMPNVISQFQSAVPKVIANAWSDPAFESLLLSNPNKAFQKYGVNLPDTISLRVIKHDNASSDNWTMTEANGKQIMTLPLPPAPSSSDSHVLQAAAACSSSSICCTG